MSATNRRFPPLWTIEELDACFIVKDSSGQKLGYFYFEEEPSQREIRNNHYDAVRALVPWGVRTAEITGEVGPGMKIVLARACDGRSTKYHSTIAAKSDALTAATSPSNCIQLDWTRMTKLMTRSPIG
jgi:hypothetical protein